MRKLILLFALGLTTIACDQQEDQENDPHAITVEAVDEMVDDYTPVFAKDVSPIPPSAARTNYFAVASYDEFEEEMTVATYNKVISGAHTNAYLRPAPWSCCPDLPIEVYHRYQPNHKLIATGEYVRDKWLFVSDIRFVKKPNGDIWFYMRLDLSKRGYHTYYDFEDYVGSKHINRRERLYTYAYPLHELNDKLNLLFGLYHGDQ